jgi:hypothetical protein
MVSVVALLVVLCAGALVGARLVSDRGRAGIAGGATIVFLVSLSIWGLLLELNIVPLDPLVRAVGAYRLEHPWLALIALTPPILIATAFAWAASRRRRQNDRL